ncbi:MAG: DNA repair protein RadC [Elusimicrobia bacterium]|nr:DNA repair protein RadC [Elusimicrobiota bacterium]
MQKTQKTKKTIKEMPRIERPREKLIRYGPEKLSDEELLAIILRTGRKGLNAIELAKSLIEKYGTGNLADAVFNEVSGETGAVRACEVIACFELGRRFLKGKKINLYMSPQDVWKELKDIRERKKEHFIVLYLDTRNQEIKQEVVSVGTLNANLVHPREVFEPAVKNLAAQIITAHNHPSGSAEPSEDDLVLTKRLVEAGKILGIEMIDHVIVTKDGYLSFKEKGLL